jgi:hypothetical protein
MEEGTITEEWKRITDLEDKHMGESNESTRKMGMLRRNTSPE